MGALQTGSEGERTAGTDGGRRWAALVLIVAGIIGVVTGIVPFTISALRIVAEERVFGNVDFAAHGVEAMGLSVEWAMLSSAMGTFLGGLLLASGAGWLRGRAWAVPVTWAYVAGGLSVNVTDMLIFAFHAKPGGMRTHMLVGDGIALAFPVLVALFLVFGRSRKSGEA